jgi:hypothetical protein
VACVITENERVITVSSFELHFALCLYKQKRNGREDCRCSVVSIRGMPTKFQWHGEQLMMRWVSSR